MGLDLTSQLSILGSNFKLPMEVRSVISSQCLIMLVGHIISTCFTAFLHRMELCFHIIFIFSHLKLINEKRLVDLIVRSLRSGSGYSAFNNTIKSNSPDPKLIGRSDVFLMLYWFRVTSVKCSSKFARRQRWHSEWNRMRHVPQHQSLLRRTIVRTSERLGSSKLKHWLGKKFVPIKLDLVLGNVVLSPDWDSLSRVFMLRFGGEVLHSEFRWI